MERCDPQQRAPLNNSNHHRLNLRIIDNQTRTNGEDVFRVTFGILDAPLTRLNTVDTGYYAITDDIRTIDKLLTDHAVTELSKINLQPTLPPDIKAKRTIFIRHVDLTVGRHTPDEIKAEIKKLQPWAKIQEFAKIKEYTHVFKLICKDSTRRNAY